jgi:hypothetical protein
MSKDKRNGETAKSVADLVHDTVNANRHTDRGKSLLRDSIKRNGFGRSILIDKNNRIIAGNATTDAADDVDMRDVIVVRTDGTKVIAVQRVDLDLRTDAAAKELALVDNRSAELNLDFDPDVLLRLQDEGVDVEAAGFSSDELAALVEAGAEHPPTELIQVDAQPPPVMTWVLIGIPTVQFGKIATEVERIAAMQGVVCETTSNNGSQQEDGQSQP